MDGSKFYETVRQMITERMNRGDHAVRCVSGIESKRAVIGAMFNHAEHSICLLAKRLEAPLFCASQVTLGAQGFFCRPDGRTRILTTDIPGFEWPHHPFVEKFGRFMEGEDARLQIRTLPSADLGRYAGFMLLDDYGRYSETGTDACVVVVEKLPNSDIMLEYQKVFGGLWGAGRPIHYAAPRELAPAL
jgi:hypothetical protein